MAPPPKERSASPAGLGGSSLRRAGGYSISSLPVVRGPPKSVMGSVSMSTVHGPTGLVRVRSGKVDFAKEAGILKGTKSICRVPELQGNSHWSLTNEAREELFRPKPKPDPTIAPAAPAPAAAVDVPKPAMVAHPPPSANPAAGFTEIESRRDRPGDVLKRRKTEKLVGPPEPPVADGLPPKMLDDYHGHERPRNDFDWIRFNNQEEARRLRRDICALTSQATKAGAYVKSGREIRLRRVSEMLEKTQRISPSLGTREPPRRNGIYSNTKVSGSKHLAIEAALELRDEHRNSIGVVSAASTYHCGGGFETGGRHALEEAICVQTTLFESISKAQTEALQELTAAHPFMSDFAPYIPIDGVVLSPQVEVFRGGSDHGYPFMTDPALLAAVISLGMFNKNDRMSDCPVDAPPHHSDYHTAVKEKFRSMFSAALQARCVALVVPDVGCGVYQNDPAEVGTCLGEVLREEFWCHFKEVVLVGKPQFQDAAMHKVEEVGARLEAALMAPPPSLSFDPSSPPSSDRRTSAGGGGFIIPDATSDRRPSARDERRRSSDDSGLRWSSAASDRLQVAPAQAGGGRTGGGAGVGPPPPHMVPSPSPGGSFLATPPPAAASVSRGRGSSPGWDSDQHSRSPSPSSPAVGGMCKFRCGRPVKEGVTRSGKPFETCCRACGRTKGDGSHDAECAGGEVVLHHGRGLEPQSNTNPLAPEATRRADAIRRASMARKEDEAHSRSPSPAPHSFRPADRPMCKFGCGRKAKAGTLKSGKPFDTCCRECAVTKGGGGHDANCDGS